jgi:putative FmdB family regulatory protein
MARMDQAGHRPDGQEDAMPVYEYRCTACGQAAELLLPMTRADAPGPCAGCSGELQRRVSRVAVKLEGWGFSRTDGMVPDRPGRGSFREVRERAERISDGAGPS